MLARSHRLRGQIPSQFFRQAQRKSTPLGLLFYQLDPTLSQAQIAFIAPKKTFPTSVARHQAKRQAAVIVREKYELFPSGRFVFLLQK